MTRKSFGNEFWAGFAIQILLVLHWIKLSHSLSSNANIALTAASKFVCGTLNGLTSELRPRV